MKKYKENQMPNIGQKQTILAVKMQTISFILSLIMDIVLSIIPQSVKVMAACRKCIRNLEQKLAI